MQLLLAAMLLLAWRVSSTPVNTPTSRNLGPILNCKDDMIKLRECQENPAPLAQGDSYLVMMILAKLSAITKSLAGGGGSQGRKQQ
jgi:hypothetical protein